MKEIDALIVWKGLTHPQRAALVSALPYEGAARGDILSREWGQIARDDQKLLLALDWNFMLGQKVFLEVQFKKGSTNNAKE